MGSITQEQLVISLCSDKIFHRADLNKGNALASSEVAPYNNNHIRKQHNGLISVASEPNTGTTFTIILPAMPDAAREDVQKADITRSKTGVRSSFHILLMDDEEIVRDVGTQLLERLGHITDTAVHGDEALKKYTEAMNTGNPFDLVIIDLTIRGGKGGKETIGELLKIHPEAKVIVSSGYSSGPIMADYSSYGFSGKLAKPFMVSDLKDAIAMAMNLNNSGMAQSN
ncbi:MAG: response regulator [Candidatus Sabulitectum sp.]|nr:response regulator [Candidatus Sabulitectum sp.]